VAIIGRPNVGKSTLFNRICGKHKALVGNEPGMTRDRISEVAEWRGREFEIIDTGGIIPREAEVIPRLIYEQAKTAIEKACAILLVVDCRVGVTSVDAELARFLFETSKPVFVVVNKCDSPKQWTQAQEFYELGFDKIFPISAEHGLNVGDLLDEVIKTFPESKSAEPAAQEETRVAIIGKPNVGKSTLLNRLLGEERVIVSPIPGTTRDAIDTLLIRDGRPYRFIDTAGIRKKSQTVLLAEKLSVIMARKSLERCDMALVVLDAKEVVSALDATIAGYAHEAGVSVILVVNKWDLIAKSESTQREYEEKIRARLKYLEYAPLLFISAETGQGVAKLLPLINEVALARQFRVGTAELNSFLQKVALHKATVPSNRQVKVYYMTQVGVAPPTFALFTNRQSKLHFSLERYLINRIRDQFGFLGTPIILKQKMERKAG
jgi:GTPase